MEIDGDTAVRIYKEAVLGVEPTDKSPEALEYRRQIEQELAQQTQGGQWHIPSEMPG